MKLGILGMSPGNGHPYSWSAIVNGYDKKAMERCEFTSIPRYLEKHDMEREMIKDTQITHIWTQDYKLTKKIAQATYIECKCRYMNEMLGKVDGVILARDDSENHYKHAEIFLKYGIPVYIDKPIATSLDEAKKLYAIQKYKGQIFTCSALRYAPEFQLDTKTRQQIGKIRSIRSTSVKDWEKYAVHIIEPSLCIGNPIGEIKTYKKHTEHGKQRLEITYQNLELHFETTGKAQGDIRIKVIGEQDSIERTLDDPFEAFKGSLLKFLEGIKSKKEIISRNEVLKIVKIIELGI